MKIDLDTWIISDTHFNHENIIKLTDSPLDRDQLISDNWRQLVGYKEPVLHLGDLFSFKKREQAKGISIAAFMSGTKYLIRGNHDHHTDEQYGYIGYKVIPEFIHEFDGKRVLFSHRPERDKNGWDINIHGHIHNNPYDFDYRANINKRYINVSIEVMDYKPVRLREILGGKLNGDERNK